MSDSPANLRTGSKAALFCCQYLFPNDPEPVAYFIVPLSVLCGRVNMVTVWVFLSHAIFSVQPGVSASKLACSHRPQASEHASRQPEIRLPNHLLHPHGVQQHMTCISDKPTVFLKNCLNVSKPKLNVICNSKSNTNILRSSLLLPHSDFRDILGDFTQSASELCCNLNWPQSRDETLLERHRSLILPLEAPSFPCFITSTENSFENTLLVYI